MGVWFAGPTSNVGFAGQPSAASESSVAHRSSQRIQPGRRDELRQPVRGDAKFPLISGAELCGFNQGMVMMAQERQIP